MDHIRFPDVRDELVELDRQDQFEVRNHKKNLEVCKTEQDKRRKNKELAEHCHARAHHMLELLKIIKEPTATNVGMDGSQAISLLALHSYLDIMKKVLLLYEFVFERTPDDVYGMAIPPLIDRIMILEHRVQSYGTNWSIGADGNLFLIEVEDFEGMNTRRLKYGLDKAKKPTVLSTGSKKHPLGTGPAEASDQKKLTEAEYQEYAQYQLKSLI